MGEVIEPSFITKLDIPVERILRKAQEAGLTTVVVMGWDADGDTYFASSVADGGEVLWLMEMCKKDLLAIGS
jgi:hypothetical protein